MRFRGVWAVIGAVSGFTAVAVGAFGAHAITDSQAKAWIEIGARYQLAHTMTILVALSFRNWGADVGRHAPRFFLAGIILFSGSLYAMALGAPRWFGAITPLGGVSFLIGWGVLAWAGVRLMGQERAAAEGRASK